MASYFLAKAATREGARALVPGGGARPLVLGLRVVPTSSSMGDSPPGRPSVLSRLSWLSDAAQEDPDPHALVAQAESGALTLLDLSANRRFAVLDAAARSRLIDRIASAASPRTPWYSSPARRHPKAWPVGSVCARFSSPRVRPRERQGVDRVRTIVLKRAVASIAAYGFPPSCALRWRTHRCRPTSCWSAFTDAGAGVRRKKLSEQARSLC